MTLTVIFILPSFFFFLFSLNECTYLILAPAQQPYHTPIMSKFWGNAEGDYISFICSANVGKPIGTIRWWKIRNDVYSADELPEKFATRQTVQPWVCEYNITSYITMALSANDDQAIIRCSVDQPGDILWSPNGLPQEKPYKETARIIVQCEYISFILE